ncbi:MAG: amidohydrolase family protein, partial [Pseudomonadota bacterium]
VDFHVDEGMNPALNGIEIVADVLEKADFNGNVLCGHVCNLMNYEPARLQPLMEKLRSQNVSIGVLPATNLYLQGRTSGTPDRRGLTRIKELNEFGINVAIGTDNVGDAFCPIGRHDPLNSLSLGVVAAHLDPPFNQWLDCITTNASQAIGLPPTHVDGAPIDKLLITNAKNTAELIAGAMPAPQSIDSFLVEATKNQEIL